MGEADVQKAVSTVFRVSFDIPLSIGCWVMFIVAINVESAAETPSWPLKPIIKSNLKKIEFY